MSEPRVFAYCRVSTADQDTQNQVLEIKGAGFNVEEHRIITEIISGSVAAEKRPEFAKLLIRLDHHDVLIVTKLDRLGRDAINVRDTIEKLATRNIRVHCLALGGIDLTSAPGKMTMQVISAIAEFELDLIKERTRAGLKRARNSGKRFGRPPALNASQKTRALELLEAGANVSQVARELGTTRQTIIRVRDSAKPSESA